VSEIGQYIAAILLEKARLGPDEAYGGSIKFIRDQLARDVGHSLTEEDVAAALASLEPFAAAESDYSPLTGGFWTILYDNFRYYFIDKKAEKEDDPADYAATLSQTINYPILEAYARRGSRYALDAASHLKNLPFAEWDALRISNEAVPPLSVPASDRLITLDHNQKSALETATSEVIAAVELENSVDGDPSLRQVLVGQLKSARELVRAQVFNAHLLYISTINALGFLIKKYGNQTIGHAAKKLLDLLIEEVFKK
jgi:hypothetical protein